MLLDTIIGDYGNIKLSYHRDNAINKKKEKLFAAIANWKIGLTKDKRPILYIYNFAIHFLLSLHFCFVGVVVLLQYIIHSFCFYFFFIIQ